MKLPPIAKIYEAFSAIADERVKIKSKEAIVKSSDESKEYQIKWNEKEISSTDNASVWQKYPGYPIIAVWLLNGTISYNQQVVKHFKNINWHEINKKNKRDYDKGVNEVLNTLVVQGIDTEEIEQEVNKIYEKIKELSYDIVRKIKE